MPDKPPFFPFYVDDFEADGVVAAMSLEQVGAYTRLLCKAWKETPAGTVPDDDDVLARWVRLPRSRWLKIKAGVMAAFKLQDGGRHYQKRMRKEYSKLMAKLEARSKAGAKAAKNRWDTECERNANVMRESVQTLSYSSSKSSNQSSSSEQGEWFAAFWAGYPRKENKAKAAAAWKKLRPDIATIGAIMAGLQAWNGSKQWADGVIPHATTWLNGRRWEDEVRPAAAGKSADLLSGLRKFNDRMITKNNEEPTQ